MSAFDSLLAGLRGAGERTRLRILYLLAQGELNVKELTQILGQSQPRISRHLKLLCEAGLLERYREGSWVLFRVSDQGIPAALLGLVADLVPPDHPEVRRDLDRLGDIKAARAAAAERYFKASAADWDKIRSLHVAEEAVERRMLEMAGRERIETMLDLGTGTGRVLELFAGRIAQGIGVDMSHAMLSIARANLERAGHTHCQVRHADLFHLPYANSSVDFITVHQVLHFLDEPVRALQEAARTLKPGGRLMVVDFAPHELEFLRERHAHRRLGVDGEQMRSWLARAGLAMQAHEVLPPAAGTVGEALTVSIWMAAAPGSAGVVRPVPGVTVKGVTST
jgi:ubiquinone/menaquinone biosynthesis C-methylase UbiE